MAQWIEYLPQMLDNLSLILRTHINIGDNQFYTVVLWPPHTHHSMHVPPPQPHIIIHKIIIIINK